MNHMLQDEISNIQTRLVGKHIFGKLQYEQKVLKDKSDAFKKQFATPIDLVEAIQTYLKSESTRQLYKKLEEFVYNEGKCPTSQR